MIHKLITAGVASAALVCAGCTATSEIPPEYAAPVVHSARVVPSIPDGDAFTMVWDGSFSGDVQLCYRVTQYPNVGYLKAFPHDTIIITDPSGHVMEDDVHEGLPDGYAMFGTCHN